MVMVYHKVIVYQKIIIVVNIKQDCVKQFHKQILIQ